MTQPKEQTHRRADVVAAYARALLDLMEEIAKHGEGANDDERAATINTWAEKYVDQGPDIMMGFRETETVAPQMILQLLIVEAKRQL